MLWMMRDIAIGQKKGVESNLRKERDYFNVNITNKFDI